jgi:hypothetical protein
VGVRRTNREPTRRVGVRRTNLRVIGVRCQMSGKKNKTLKPETLVIGIWDFYFFATPWCIEA